MKSEIKPGIDGQVLVIGLDGACWSVLGPLIESGKTPVLGKLAGEGVTASLLSPWPGATFPSWTSIMTGTSPGVHGLLDFSELDPSSYTVRFVDSRTRRIPAIWEIATRAGKRTAVLGVPGTYPPDRDVSLMISGFDTPVTTSIDPTFIWPPDWRSKLFSKVGSFPLTPVQELRIGKGWHEKAWMALQESIEGKTRVAEYVLGELDPDLFVMVFGESDTVSHHFWHFADPESPRRDSSVGTELSNAIEDVYIRLDGALGRILESADRPKFLLLVSDHGFGGTGSEAIYINRFLEDENLLQFSGPSKGVRTLSKSLISMGSRLPRTWQQMIFRRAGSRLVRFVESKRRLGGIAWGGTIAYSEELNYAPSVRINLKGREGKGTIGRDRYNEIRCRVKDALLSWKDRLSGEAVVNRVWFREELLEGPAVERAPDLLLDLNIPNGYSYVILPSSGEAGAPQKALFGKELSGEKGKGMHGSHRREGVMIAWGTGLEAGRIEEPVQADQMAAVVLSALGVSVPCWIADPPMGLPGFWKLMRDSSQIGSSGKVVDSLATLEFERMRRLRELGYLS